MKQARQAATHRQKAFSAELSTGFGGKRIQSGLTIRIKMPRVVISAMNLTDKDTDALIADARRKFDETSSAGLTRDLRDDRADPRIGVRGRP